MSLARLGANTRCFDLLPVAACAMLVCDDVGSVDLPDYQACIPPLSGLLDVAGPYGD